MSKDPKNIEEIEQYLSGNLTPEARNDFEKELEKDSNLQVELKTTAQVIEGIQGHAFKKILKSLHDKHFPKTS